MKMDNVDDAVDLLWIKKAASISCRYSFFREDFLVFSAGFFLNIFFLAGSSFLVIGAFLLTPTLASWS